MSLTPLPPAWIVSPVAIMSRVAYVCVLPFVIAFEWLEDHATIRFLLVLVLVNAFGLALNRDI
jgi:hypothetical protein